LPAPLVGFDRLAGGSRLRCVFNLSGAEAAVPRALAATALPGAPVGGVEAALPPWGVALGRAG
jgi:hypothetical protein